MQKKMTIFTPTYNRAYILTKLYDSLCGQTVKDFEWLIVDDGSEDNTKELVDTWIKDDIIDIRYYKQKNGGKQRAHNLGVSKSEGKLFVCVDSDDYILPEFVEKHLQCIEKYEDNQKVGGIISLQGHEDGRPMGTYFPKNLNVTTLTKLYGKMRFKGDATIVHYTDILKKYPFHVAKGEKFIGEGYVYYQIDQKYELAVLPQILMIKEYLPDGYTKNVRKLTKDNPKSYMLLKRQSVKYASTRTEKFIQSILYDVGCIMAKKNAVTNTQYKLLAILTYLPAVVAWLIFYKNA